MHQNALKFLFGSLACGLSLLACQERLAPTETEEHRSKPRVFIFTDINIDDGDPDDRQSLVHLLWYANELKIEGIVPDRWSAQGYQACSLAVNAYAEDYQQQNLQALAYPEPTAIRSLIAPDYLAAEALFQAAAADTSSPLYVLVWGNMRRFGDALRTVPELAYNIRLLTIGTGLMLEKDNPHLPPSWPKAEQACEQYNWNGFGRDSIFYDQRFQDLWWVELNWTYAGMFTGPEPKQMWDSLANYGVLGEHLIEVTENQPWARYFRVGDTPTVLYLIDPDNTFDDPGKGSWAGRFIRPFPREHPNFYTDDAGELAWNYQDPCASWDLHLDVAQAAKSTLEARRPQMYEALLDKLRRIYE
ncbi:MAG: nucleoside hydrolase-like domain-containing protein [Bacteroidota bacterium]